MPEKLNIKNTQSFFFTNIGGAGMSAIAGFLAKSGKNVSGTESHCTPYLHTLKTEDVVIQTTFHEDMIPKKNDTVMVISSATPADDPAYRYAQNHHIPCVHRSVALSHIVRDFQSICVTGTHGKSTTTTLLFDAFYKSETPLSILTGAFIHTIKSNYYHSTKSPYLICECDESDGTISTYSPHICIITNIDEDHMEHYESHENLIRAFTKLIKSTHESGLLLINGDDPITQILAQQYTGTVITYGFSSRCMYRIIIQHFDDQGVTFSVSYKGQTLCQDVTVPIPGKYNAFNACPAIILAHIWGMPLSTIAENLTKTKGLVRRMQDLTPAGSTPRIIDDYAHHPTAITAAIQALTHKDSRPTVVMQPHRIRRLLYHMDAFAHALVQAAHTIVTPVYTPNTDQVIGQPHHALAKKIQEMGGSAQSVDSFDDLTHTLVEKMPHTQSFLFCSAGDLSEFAHCFAQRYCE